MPEPAVNARLQVLGAALLFGTGGAAIKLTTLAPLQVAGLRSTVAALALLVLVPDARRGYGRDLAPAALAYAATLVLFVVATKLTTSAAAIFLQSMAPIWVVALSPALLGERIDRRELPFLAAAGVALTLVLLGSLEAVSTAPAPHIGNALALASGLTFGLLLIALRRIARAEPERNRSMPAAVLGNALASVACLPFSLPIHDITARDLLALGYLGTFQVGGAYWLLGHGLRSVPALEASLLLLLEPVLNPVWSWLVHGERPSALASLGGALLIAVLLLRSRYSITAPSNASHE